MLVDDEVSVLDIEAEMLEDLGYDVVKFSSSPEALKYYENNYKEIAFSVVDIVMPERAEEIFRTNPHCFHHRVVLK
jgi:FixJ family two-component response regulator